MSGIISVQAKQAIFKKLVQEEPDKYPARMGQAWNDDETLKLLKAVRANQTFEEMARAHQRTVGAIRAKLRSLACDYYFNENRSVEQIMKFTGLSKDSIVDAITKRQYQINNKEKCLIVENIKSNELPQIKEVLSNSLLIEIRDLLKELVDIMKEK